MQSLSSHAGIANAALFAVFINVGQPQRPSELESHFLHVWRDLNATSLVSGTAKASGSCVEKRSISTRRAAPHRYKCPRSVTY